MADRWQSNQEEQAEDKLCQNCRHVVAASNFLVHSVHCQRNITLCPDCSTPVLNSSLEEHRTTHAATRCPDCRCSLELQHLTEHKDNDCPKRLATCEFCELSCHWDVLPEHMEYCGSRTQECPNCGCLVLLRDKQHQCPPPGDVQHLSGQLDALKFSGQDAEDDVYDDLWYPPQDLVPRAGSDTSSVPDAYLPEEVQLPCEFCSLLCPMEDLILHQSGCGLMQLRREQGSPEPRPPDEPSLPAMCPCEICEELVPLDELQTHELCCTLEPRVPLEQEEKDVLPCELCHQCFPASALARHQATCDLSPEEALRSDELYPPMAGECLSPYYTK